MQWESIAGAIVSSSAVAWLAKLYIEKSLGELDVVAEKLSTIGAQLAVISVKLASAEGVFALVQEHDRKIFALEQLYATHRQTSAASSSRQECGRQV
jgi:Holliday junction resolvase-like predicted endonuclease